MLTDELLALVLASLDELKALNVTVIDVRGKTSITDYMVIATGTSDRHVRAVAEHVVLEAKHAGELPIGVEGEREGEWALVDLTDVIVHVMRAGVREFYALEKLWDMDAPTGTG
jgi:ribosome-associated protein